MTTGRINQVTIVGIDDPERPTVRGEHARGELPKVAWFDEKNGLVRHVRLRFGASSQR